MNQPTVLVPMSKEIQRALRLVESQRRASRNYYMRHKEEIKQKSVAYWEAHKTAINERRRKKYAVNHPAPIETSPTPQ